MCKTIQLTDIITFIIKISTATTSESMNSSRVERYSTFKRVMSNTRVALGGISGGDPLLP